ncbi:MAG TPA: ABC transporter ATP-binding protein [Prevotella sp.]|nr:ABC transporter ATP-binding protein [Prevotella sp.]
MIEISHVSYKYNGSKQDVFEDLDLTLQENHIYGLLGKNGMGKTTLLYLLSGLLQAQEGSILFDGKDVSDRLPEVLQETFLVPEEFEFPSLSMREFVAIHRTFYPRFREEVLKDCLNAFELPDEPNLKALSMGQKKKVYMSMALASGTRLLLMDEPTNGLDIPSKSLFRKVIAQNMSEDRMLLISTHQVHDVESLLDHLLILDQSRILLNQSVSEVTARYSFGYRPLGTMDEGILYAEPALQGNAVITHRDPHEAETPLNLELLFNAMTKGIIQ